MDITPEITGWSGGIPFGYRYNHDTSSIETLKSEKETLLIVIDLRRKGMGVNQIAQQLNSMGHKSRSGRDWSNIAVGYLLSEKRLLHYAGFNPDKKKGYWETFISLHDVKKLAVGKETGKRANKAEYLLTGLNIMKCGYCGGSVKSSVTFRSKGEKTQYYACTTKAMKGSSICSSSKLVRQEVVNELVINDLIIKHAGIDVLEKEYISLGEKELQKANSILMDMQQEMRDLLMKSGSVKNPKELQSIKAKISSLTNSIDDTLEKSFTSFDFGEFRKSPVKKIKSMDMEKQKELIYKFISKIELFNDHLIIKYRFRVTTELEY